MLGRYLLKAFVTTHAAVYRWTGGRLMGDVRYDSYQAKTERDIPVVQLKKKATA